MTIVTSARWREFLDLGDADMSWRGYQLAPENQAVTFDDADWYRTPIPRKRLKQLMRRDDQRALYSFGLWLACVLGSAMAIVLTWGTWFVVPALFVYGVFYGSGSHARWHELSHGTPFKTRWLNEAFFHLVSFMSLKNPYSWRWSHTRHHTHTVIVGHDPEIAYPRPPDLMGMFLNILHLRVGWTEIARLMRQSFGILDQNELDFVPKSEHGKTFWIARLYIAIFAGIILLSLALGSLMPVVLVGLPTFYGNWLHNLLSATQHAGLIEDFPDHRLNSRTVYMNPLLRFIYCNMNYHIEHHMYPMVPFYSLPELHDEIKADCPLAYESVLAAYREMIPAMRRQLLDPTHFVPRHLPATAAPSRWNLPHAAA